jgi:DNA-binding transcriptional LysR family regulator
MDYLRSLAVFVRVSELGSMSAAAAEFGVSPTMIGKHIQALEQRAGGRLFVRTTRRQSLSELGTHLLGSARTILSEVAAADALGEQIKESPRGTLRISAPTALGIGPLIQVVAEYQRRYPEVQVDVNLTERVVDLEDEGMHVAIRVGPIGNPDLIAHPLSAYEMVACASPAYLKRAARLTAPDDLSAHNCLRFSGWGSKPVWRFIRNAATSVVPVRGGFIADNLLAIREAAAAGLGVTVLSKALVGKLIENGELVRVLPKWRLKQRPVHALWPQHMRALPKVRAFISILEERMGGA